MSVCESQGLGACGAQQRMGDPSFSLPSWRPLTLQFHRMPEVMSWWQRWHCDTKLGASGLCRWYRTIIDECFARRKKSYW